MKKSMICLLLCVAVFFSGCGQASSPPKTNSVESPEAGSQTEPNAAGAADAADTADAADVVLVTSRYGAFDEAGGKDGFYKLCMNPGGGSNILYADYATGSVTFLCSRPECLHRDEGCPAWFPFDTGSIFLNAQQDTLFCIGSADSGAQQAEAIWAMDPNGANRRLFYQCASQERITDAIASDAAALYFAVSTADASTGTAGKRLLRVDLQTGQSEALCAYGPSDWLSGVCGNRLLLLFSGDGGYQYTLFSPSDGAQTECYRFESDPDRPESSVRVYPDSGFLYVFSPNGDDTAQLLKFDILSGTSAQLCDGFPWYGAGTAFIQGVYDNYLIIDQSDTRENDPAKVRHHRYFIDCETGGYTESSLTYSQGALVSFVTVSAETQDRFVVSHGVRSTPVFLTGTDGTLYEATFEVPAYALISKADYWAGNPNYQELDMAALFS